MRSPESPRPPQGPLVTEINDRRSGSLKRFLIKNALFNLKKPRPKWDRIRDWLDPEEETAELGRKYEFLFQLLHNSAVILLDECDLTEEQKDDFSHEILALGEEYRDPKMFKKAEDEGALFPEALSAFRMSVLLMWATSGPNPLAVRHVLQMELIEACLMHQLPIPPQWRIGLYHEKIKEVIESYEEGLDFADPEEFRLAIEENPELFNAMCETSEKEESQLIQMTQGADKDIDRLMRLLMGKVPI